MKPAPTPFGEVVLDLFRDRRVADVSELGLHRLDVRALRRHFEGDNNNHRREMPENVATALDLTDEERTRMAVAWIGRDYMALLESRA